MKSLLEGNSSATNHRTPDAFTNAERENDAAGFADTPSPHYAMPSGRDYSQTWECEDGNQTTLNSLTAAGKAFRNAWVEGFDWHELLGVAAVAGESCASLCTVRSPQPGIRIALRIVFDLYCIALRFCF